MATSDLKDEREQLQRERVALRQQQQENQSQLQLTFIYQRARNKNGQLLKQCVANENQIRDLHMDVRMFLEAIKRDDIAKMFIWVDDPHDAKVEQRDRSAFTEFCKAHRFNDGVAGFNLAREILGAGNLNEHSLAEAVRSRRLQLAAASADELAEREEERQDAEKLRLLNTPAHQLKQEAAQGILEAKAKAAQAQADYEYGLRVEAEKGSNFPPLPEFFEGPFPILRGLKIDRKFFFNKNVTREVYKFLHMKYGGAAVEKRIRQGVR